MNKKISYKGKDVGEAIEVNGFVMNYYSYVWSNGSTESPSFHQREMHNGAELTRYFISPELATSLGINEPVFRGEVSFLADA